MYCMHICIHRHEGCVTLGALFQATRYSLIIRPLPTPPSGETCLVWGLRIWASRESLGKGTERSESPELGSHVKTVYEWPWMLLQGDDNPPTYWEVVMPWRFSTPHYELETCQWNHTLLIWGNVTRAQVSWCMWMGAYNYQRISLQ